MKNLQAFARDDRGNAIVEFGLIAPMIVGVIVLIGQTAVLGYSMLGMRNAVHSGAMYVMGGSRSVNDIKAVMAGSWSNKPSNSTMSVTQYFKCGTADGTEGVLCADNKLPAQYFRVRAQANFGGVWDHNYGISEVVRVR
ncbi:MAG TPA: hypothetical protein VF559_12220 [Caulobacteraceae bacterium]|jgi:Flp pilus assembly protein TadG